MHRRNLSAGSCWSQVRRCPRPPRHSRFLSYAAGWRCSIPAAFLLYLTDRIRTAALRAGPSLNVVSRENLVVLLQASGKTMEQCEGECDVETGRLVGADLVVSGEALTVDGSFKLSLKLHATKNGRIFSGSVASGTSFDELDGDVPRAEFELLRPVWVRALCSPVVEKPKAKRTSSSESLFDPQSMCHGELALRGVAYV